jgi:acyl carrier protein
MEPGASLSTVSEVKKVLADVLQIGSRTESWDSSTSLLGSVPELDSMAVVGVIGALEEHFGITVADDEITAETFSTLSTLTAFIEQKLQSAASR